MTDTKIISGKKFKRAYTLNTQYANGNIELMDKDDVQYRINVSVLFDLIKQEKFVATMKKKYYHLTLVE